MLGIVVIKIKYTIKVLLVEIFVVQMRTCVMLVLGTGKFVSEERPPFFKNGIFPSKVVKIDQKGTAWFEGSTWHA